MTGRSQEDHSGHYGGSVKVFTRGGLIVRLRCGVFFQQFVLNVSGD
jgi:hypothetical protein